ncbi:phosphoenolpyruvate--protein phosphotransferase [Terasakiella sp. SH-1]|uniref:phosphoenolpyruvate--protein phosphotransferase n=1 Tax=Terasakiella sp. SH-1 TaxID=2560057 RepID=UPI0010739CD6|nr:phosphoenolpyruvate--protein phosphotransferase [Terasakiella sp. SH-1]
MEQIFEGLGVSSGIGFGIAHIRESGSCEITEYCIPKQHIGDELVRLDKALEASRDQIAKLRQKSKDLPEAAAEELGFLLDAHLHMLKGSRLVRGIEREISENGINAEAAVQHVLNEISESFKQLDDAYIASRESDVHQVAARIIRNLCEDDQAPFSELAENSIIIAEELTPADTALMDPKKVSGFAAVLGGPESHTAIMGRALNLPAVLGATNLVGSINTGDHIIIDGDAGRIVVNPTEATKHHYLKRAQEYLERITQLAVLKDRPAITCDGVQVTLKANIELPVEIDNVLDNGAEGVGLLRSEFMYMNRDTLPSEDDQYDVFKHLIERLEGKPLTVRTLDIGGDKTAKSLIDDFGDSICSPLGMRGIRLSLNRPDILETQYRALLRAAVHGPLQILLPMVTTVNDVRQARRILHSVASQLRDEGYELADYLPPLGAMIEVPGAALAADALAQVCEFFAIGSNDLTMYTLATDRADEQVAHLYDPLHPAVLRLIQFTTQAALRNRIPISLCGEIAANPRYSALLLGLGIRDFSMSASNIPKVKERLLEMECAAATKRADIIMEQTDSTRIAMLLDDFSDRGNV